MIATLRGIVIDSWQWRSQAWRLALTELSKRVRGTVLGWIWLLLRPAIYVGVFWFALAIGLREVSPVAGTPYLIWLASGLFPWFYMRAMLGTGSNVYRRYGYLVNRMRFPITVISGFVSVAEFVVFLITMSVLFLLLVVYGVGVSIYALQAVVIAALMYVFWTLWSMMMSPLCALSKDVAQLLRTLTTPLFWLSGVLFPVERINIEWIRWVLAFNPITFFVTGFRAGFSDRYWLWDTPAKVWPFAVTFVVVLLLALLIQSRARSEIADVV
jgi:teichoic acid transport system permease protein